jgi:ppGpp synthetase/RelA/SpoT-type nucleotidyltranferase
MRISEQVIEEAVARYERERDRYLKLAARVADICRASIVEENAIRAQVTFRTKTVRSFEGKLRRFAKQDKKNFATVEEVFAGIGDFAGVRIATYRPEDEGRVTDQLERLFAGEGGGEVEVDVKDKLNPDSGNFYRGKHCQVYLRDEDLVGNYENVRATGCEVQVCSMMAHVWNEIEHDIGYKPEGGGPGEAERGLLEALGHLTRSGDATITRLLAANAARLQERTGDFEDVHDFVARLRRFFPEADLSVNAGQAFDEARLLGLVSLSALQHELGAEALDEKVARARVAAFNVFLDAEGAGENALNPASSDLITVSMLERFVDRIEENHPAGRGKGRPARIYYIAKWYRRFLDARTAGEAKAA